MKNRKIIINWELMPGITLLTIILALIFIAPNNAQAQETKNKANEPTVLGVENGEMKFETPVFRLGILKSSQTASSLSITTEGKAFDFTPGEIIQQRTGNNFYHLGDINLKLRSAGENNWTAYSTASSRQRVKNLVPSSSEVFSAADLNPSFPQDFPLEITRYWEKAGDNIALRFEIKNPGNNSIEIGALGIPLIFNNNLNGKTLDEAHEDNVFFDPYIGMDAGYLQVVSLKGTGKVLLALPLGHSPFEAYRPLNDDPTPRGITFEGFHEWMVHSKAYAENEWKDADQWNKPSSIILSAGQTISYGLKFVLADNLRDIENTLIANNHPVSVGIPGTILPLDVEAKLFVRHSSKIKSLTIEPSNALKVKKLKSKSSGWETLEVNGKTWGRARLSIQFEDGLTQTVNYKVIDPEPVIVKKIGEFLTNDQWFENNEDPFDRSPSVISYDYDKKEQVLQESRAWIAGLSDEGGAGSWLAAMMKIAIMPDKEEVEKLENFVNQTIWGGIQYNEGEKKYGVKKSMFYVELDSMPKGTYNKNINDKVWSAWSHEAANSTGRSYNYPHVVAAHWSLYKLARNHENLVTQHDWKWYLENAYYTSLAMIEQAPHYAQFGQMEGTIFLILLNELKAEGFNSMATTLSNAMKKRAKHWYELNYPFGSEMPWDSTGQEEVYMWSRYFGFDEKAMITLNAILAYMPTVSHWAYNGNARRYWDFLFAGKLQRIERQIHHYGSGLNAIPVLHEYRLNPDDLYLLRVGYGGLLGSISNVTKDGFGPCAFHSYPSSLVNDGYSGDYGPGFFGYAVNTSSYLTYDNNFGWLSFGGNMKQKGDWIKVDVTTAAKSRFFIAPIGLWLELDAGNFKSLSYNVKNGNVKITLETKDKFTPTAYLKMTKTAKEKNENVYELSSYKKNDRGAYIIPLSDKPLEISIQFRKVLSDNQVQNNNRLVSDKATSEFGVIPYKNPDLSVELRVNDLMQRMSMEEKTNQLRSMFDWFSEEDIKKDSIFENAKVEHHGFLQPMQLELISNVRCRNAVQKHLMEKTRLGIPAIFVDEALHGLAKNQATSFPQAIALGSTWNEELIEEIFSAIANETRARGSQLVLSPVVDVARDPRWGRVEECYGEDPYHAGKIGAAAVRGLQGSADGQIMPGHVAATLKHYVGHGAKEGGRNKAPANLSETVLRELHIEPFRIAINESHPIAIMPSYNEINSLPLHANSYLLKEVLRDQLGFKGLLVSDYWSIGELSSMHRIAEDRKQAALKSFNAGVECDFPDGGCFQFLPELINEGNIDIVDIDKAVAKVLELKFRLGLFEDPYVDEDYAIALSKSEKHKALTIEAASQSIILLKNKNNILPLDKNKKMKIAVIGPNANDTRLGEYAGTPYYKRTVLEAIKEDFKAAEVVYSEGCKITENLLPDSRESWFLDSIAWPTKEDNMKRIKEAQKIAQNSDVIILVIGENEMICRESWSYGHLGDNSTLQLLSHQGELFDAMKATGKPVIVCLNHGRPLDIRDISEQADAILDCWYSGQETGTAIAGIISGKFNPSGKLTVTYPTSIGQLPVNYNRKPSSARNYVSEKFGWIYPFGHGLSYTNFTYDSITLSNTNMAPDDEIVVNVNIRNSGKRTGAEVVQLYIRDDFSSITRPVKELKAFKRVELKPGESKSIHFPITRETLSFWDVDGNHTLEEGSFTLMIGSSSEDIRGERKLLVAKP